MIDENGYNALSLAELVVQYLLVPANFQERAADYALCFLLMYDLNRFYLVIAHSFIYNVYLLCHLSSILS